MATAGATLERAAARILVIDDDETYSQLLTYILHKEGFTVQTAINGLAAIEKDFDVLPDLIILDLAMPEMDGFQLARLFKAHDTLRKIKILVCSARRGPKDLRMVVDVGVDDFLPKPFATEELIARVNALLARP